MARFVRNLVRLPGRTWMSLLQWQNPAYRLQQCADRIVPRWLDERRRQELSSIPGFTSERELRLLAHLVRNAPGTGYLVIGAFKGRSTAWLVEAAQARADRPAVISIDPHLRDTWEAFGRLVKRFDLQQRGLKVIRGFSSDLGRTWSRPISFLWIDGSHEFPDVRADIDWFTPHVVAGGWIVFDDARGGHFPGVERAVAERMIGNTDFEHVGAVKHFELFRRRSQKAVA